MNGLTGAPRDRYLALLAAIVAVARVAALAALLPARRAARGDPGAALRAE